MWSLSAETYLYLSAEKIYQKSWRMNDETYVLYSSAETYSILKDECWNLFYPEGLVLKLSENPPSVRLEFDKAKLSMR